MDGETGKRPVCPRVSMRSQLATAVRDIFSSHMKQEFPQFAPLEPTGVLQGGLLYQWAHARNLTCYIYLQISAKDDSFIVELSCSRGEFPINLVAFGPNDIR